MLKNVQAVIFDLDGTLIDSMWVWDKIDIDYLKELGCNKPTNLKDEICHLSFEETACYFKNTFKISNSIEEIMNTWHTMAYKHYENTIKLKPGAKDFLIALKNKGIKIGLATSSSIPLLEICLKNNGVYDLFDAITTTSEVTRGKNYPDVYLLSAQKLEVAPAYCLVFEDILPAVKGAKAAGMRVVGIYDEASITEQESLKELCTSYIETYEDLVI